MGDKDSGGIKGFNVGFGPGGSGDGAREVAERGPFRIVVLSAVAPSDEFSTGAAPHPDAMPIDKVSFDRVMEQISPSLAIEVRDPFAPSDPAVRVDLRFRELRGLRPDAIVEQVPLLRALVDARKVVQQVKDRRLSAADARAQLARILPKPSWAEMLTGEVADKRAPGQKTEAKAGPGTQSAAKAAAGNVLDDLLAQVDIGGGDADESFVAEAPPSAEPSKISAIVSAVAKSARGDRGAIPPAVVGSAPEKVEKAFARILGDILQHPETRRLERAWRGLRLLVDNVDFRAGVEVDLIPADASRIEEALKKLADRAGLETERAPVDLFVVDHEVHAVAADLERVGRWAELAEAFRAPMVLNGDASLLGADDLLSLGKTLKRLATFDDPRSVAVRGLASRECTRWVAIALNGVLVRPPYTAQSARVREIPFEEDATDRGAHVFCGSAYVIAALAAKSYVKHGWGTAITGPRDGALGNLPVHEVKDGGHTAAIPVEVFVTQEAQVEVARAGIALLSSAANHDAALVGKAPVLYRGPTAGARQDAPATSTLSDQLFVGRLANAIEQLAAAVPGDSDPNAAADVARLMIAELFASAPPPGPEIQVAVDTKARALHVTVRPRRFAGISLEEVTLGAALG